MQPTGALAIVIPLVGVVLSLCIPIVVIIMLFLTKMKKNRHEKEIRQMIIENNVEPETAKLLIDEPKKAKTPGAIDLGTLRTACILLGLGLGAGIDRLVNIDPESTYFWLIIGFGIGIGMLCSFLVELRLIKKQLPTKSTKEAFDEA